MGGISDAANFTLVSNYLLFFLTGIAGVRPAVAGTITGAGTMISALWGPVVGYLSDHARTRLGKRRLFLLLAMAPYFTAVVLCFTVIKGGEALKAAYYGLLVIVFWSSFSTFYSPWLALGASYTTDYNGRLELRQTTYTVTQLGVVLGGSLPPLAVQKMQDLGLSEEKAWRMMAVLIGLAGFIGLCIAFVSSRDKDPSTENAPKGRFSLKELAKDYLQVLSLKPMTRIAASCLCFITAQGIVSASRIYYMNYNLGLEPALKSLITFLGCAACMIMTVPITALSKKRDKKDAIVLFELICAAGFVMIYFFGGDSFYTVLVLTVVYSAGSTAFWQLTPNMDYDICEYDDLIYGKRREGVVSSLQNSLEMVCSGLASMVLGWLLQLSGFVEGASAQSAGALAGIRFSLMLIPAAFLVGCSLVMRGYPLDRETFAGVVKELEERKKRQ